MTSRRMLASFAAMVLIFALGACGGEEHNDWFFSKYAPDGTIDVAGRAEGCQTCHGSEPDGNYIMTGDL